MYDLIVCGGGTAGCAVAIAAAEQGLKVLLCEQFAQLGGIITSSCVGYIMDSRDKNDVLPGLLKDIFAHCSVGGSTVGGTMVNSETMKYYLEDRLVNAGVELRYFTRVIGVDKAGDKITSVVLSQKSDVVRESASIYVDCTGDGELGYMAGCSYDLSAPDKRQPASFYVLVTGIEYDEVKDFLFNTLHIYSEDAKTNLLKEFKRAGFTPTYLCPTLGYIENGLFFYGINHQFLNDIGADELTRATVLGRREVFESVRALKSLGGCWKNLTVVNSPGMIGVREGRRIKGVKTVTKDDLIAGTSYENSMCNVTHAVDIHDKNGYNQAGIKAKPYDIPIEAMTSSEISNLYMAGRCISGDYYAYANYRLSGNTITMGWNLGKHLSKALKTQ